MRLRTPLFCLAGLGFVSLVGCGGATIGTLRNAQVSIYEGSYEGGYTGIRGEKGAMKISVARDASFLGTVTDGITGKTGPLSGIVSQDGHFKASYHYVNETTQYSGTGIMTPPVTLPASSSTANGVTTTIPAMRGFSGTWNLTTPTVTTYTFSISGETGTAQ